MTRYHNYKGVGVWGLGCLIACIVVLEFELMPKSLEGSSKFELWTFSIRRLNWPGLVAKEADPPPSTSPGILSSHNTRPPNDSNYFIIISCFTLAEIPTRLQGSYLVIFTRSAVVVIKLNVYAQGGSVHFLCSSSAIYFSSNCLLVSPLQSSFSILILNTPSTISPLSGKQSQ